MRGLLFLAFVVGCSSTDPATPGSNEPVCQEKLDECLGNQMACVIDGGSESCEPCPTGEYAAKDGACTAIGGEKLSHTFPENTTPPGGELRGLCRSWTLDNDQDLWVNAVETEQDESSHHSNWTFVPEDMYDGPDGIWPCKDRGYDQLSAAVAGGVIYAQSTQAVREVQKFPDGVVVRIPARSRIISDIHTLNTTSEEVKGAMTLNLYALPEDDVKVKLVPFHVDYHGLDIPPKAHSRFTGECAVTEQFQSQTGKPLDMDVYYLLPHTHALGSRMFVQVLGGERDGESLIDVYGTVGEARGRAYDPPISMAGADGFRFGCEFQNPRDESVGWGFDDQEMCEALGFARMPLAFEARISTAEPDGSDGSIQKFTGPCVTAAFPWDK